MNYGDLEVPFTRIAEHKHFAPWEEHEGTVCFRETSRLAGEDDIPYYPIRLANDKSRAAASTSMRPGARTGVTFVGRLGTYRYLDMDVTIGEALVAADGILDALDEPDRHPVPVRRRLRPRPARPLLSRSGAPAPAAGAAAHPAGSPGREAAAG